MIDTNTCFFIKGLNQITSDTNLYLITQKLEDRKIILSHSEHGVELTLSLHNSFRSASARTETSLCRLQRFFDDFSLIIKQRPRVRNLRGNLNCYVPLF